MLIETCTTRCGEQHDRVCEKVERGRHIYSPEGKADAEKAANAVEAANTVEAANAVQAVEQRVRKILMPLL